MAESGGVCRVNQVLARRRASPQDTEYLVRWAGDDVDEASWASADQLNLSAQSLIAKFNEFTPPFALQTSHRSGLRQKPGKSPVKVSPTFAADVTSVTNHSSAEAGCSKSLEPGRWALRRFSHDSTLSNTSGSMAVATFKNTSSVTAKSKRTRSNQSPTTNVPSSRSTSPSWSNCGGASAKDSSPRSALVIRPEISSSPKTPINIITEYGLMSAPLTPSPSVKSPRGSPCGAQQQLVLPASLELIDNTKPVGIKAAMVKRKASRSPSISPKRGPRSPKAAATSLDLCVSSTTSKAIKVRGKPSLDIASSALGSTVTPGKVLGTTPKKKTAGTVKPRTWSLGNEKGQKHATGSGLCSTTLTTEIFYTPGLVKISPKMRGNSLASKLSSPKSKTIKVKKKPSLDIASFALGSAPGKVSGTTPKKRQSRIAKPRAWSPDNEQQKRYQRTIDSVAHSSTLTPEVLPVPGLVKISPKKWESSVESKSKLPTSPKKTKSAKSLPIAGKAQPRKRSHSSSSDAVSPLNLGDVTNSFRDGSSPHAFVPKKRRKKVIRVVKTYPSRTGQGRLSLDSQLSRSDSRSPPLLSLISSSGVAVAPATSPTAIANSPKSVPAVKSKAIIKGTTSIAKKRKVKPILRIQFKPGGVLVPKPKYAVKHPRGHPKKKQRSELGDGDNEVVLATVLDVVDELEGEPRRKPGPKPGLKLGRKPGPKPGLKLGRKPGPKPGLKLGRKPGPKPGLKPGPKPHEKPGPKPRQKPGPKPRQKPGPKPRQKPGPKPRQKPGPKPRGKPGPKPRQKPGPKPKLSKSIDGPTESKVPQKKLTSSPASNTESSNVPFTTIQEKSVVKRKTINLTIDLAKKLKTAAKKRVTLKELRPTLPTRAILFTPRSQRKSQVILPESPESEGDPKNSAMNDDTTMDDDAKLSAQKDENKSNLKKGQNKSHLKKIENKTTLKKGDAKSTTSKDGTMLNVRNKHKSPENNVKLGKMQSKKSTKGDKNLKDISPTTKHKEGINAGNVTPKKSKKSESDVSKATPKKKTLAIRPISPDTSDDDVLYSLNPEYDGDNDTESSGSLTSPSNQTDTEFTAILGTETQGSASAALSPRKLLLKDSIKPKTKVVKPVPRQAGPPVSPANAATVPEAANYKTSPNSTMRAALGHGDTQYVYMSDLPTVPVLPLIATSPSAVSYQTHVRDLPHSLQPARGPKRSGKNSDSGEDEVERRVSVRNSESAFRYKEIIVKKCAGYTQIWLFTTSKTKNALNPKVLQELSQALHNAKFDDSRVVLLSGSGSIFCSGVDLNYLLSGDRRQSAQTMADAVRDFVNVVIAFPKPIIAAVNGPAIGLGVAILPLCDIIYASDKASFSCPYGRLAQTPEGCSSFTFPQVIGIAMANDVLLGGRKLTAIEAYQMGLVSQVFWPTSMMQEVIPRVQHISNQSIRSLEGSKLLIRSHQRGKMELTNESECRMLVDRWMSAECQKAMRTYLDDELDYMM